MSRLHRLATATAVCLSLGPAAFAQSHPGIPVKAIGQRTQTGPVPSLFVLNADGATLADGKLTLTGVSANSIVFADRPVRSAGHIETKQFIDTWRDGEDNFAIDPPNATVSVLNGADVADAVVTISAPVLEGDTLTFDATTLEGGLDGATGVVALFIDDRGGGGGHGGGGDHGGGDHFNNYSQVQDPHGAYYKSNDDGDTYNRNVNVDGNDAGHNGYNGYGGWDGGYPAGAGAVGLATGAAIGAAAAGRAANYPACGYPPYPPCY